MASVVSQHIVEVFVNTDPESISETVTGGAVGQHAIEVFVTGLPSRSVVGQHAIEVFVKDIAESQETYLPKKTTWVSIK